MQYGVALKDYLSTMPLSCDRSNINFECHMIIVIVIYTPETVQICSGTRGSVLSEKLYQFTFKTEKFRKSLFPDCVRKWNRLDKDIRAVVSHNSFKNKIVTDKCSPSSLFYLGQRKFNIIHAQLRMNCSNLSAHLYSLHVVNSPGCICSHTAEDAAHYFLDCPLYYAQRMTLRNVVTRYTQFDLNVLLYGDSGIDHDRNVVIVQAVHDYIRDSERF